MTKPASYGSLITDAGTLYDNTVQPGDVNAARHFIAGQATGTPPATTNKGANVTSATFSGNDVRGTCTIVMGGALAANTRIFTATFITAFTTTPVITLVNQTSGVGLTIVNFYIQAQSTGVSFDVAADQALAAGTYTISYVAVG